MHQDHWIASIFDRWTMPKGGHELLHLQTSKVVKRRNLTKISITPSIIKQVHALAELEEMPQGLK
jgi:hypothetical protein